MGIEAKTSAIIKNTSSRAFFEGGGLEGGGEEEEGRGDK